MQALRTLPSGVLDGGVQLAPLYDLLSVATHDTPAFGKNGFPFANGARGFYTGSISRNQASDRISEVPPPGTVALSGARLIPGSVTRQRRR